ncbi:MAG: sulfatase [Planctomycetota bacterium]|jgi:arylsulfatase A-like enzyme
MRAIASITILVALSLTFSLTATAQLDPAKPNILFISIDDLNDWVGVLGGHPQAKTPNLDRLAASGVLFTNAHCPAPACNPSRTAIFSGLAPYTSGLITNTQKMREVIPDADLMPVYFAKNGYHTMGGGKLLHYITDGPSWHEYFPSKDKFQPNYYYPKKRPHSLPYEKWMYIEFDWGGFDFPDEDFMGDVLTMNWASEKLHQEYDKPFYLAVGIYRPHLPWFAPQKYFDMFPLDEVQLPPGYIGGDLNDVPEAGNRVANGRYHRHINGLGLSREAVQAYLACIAYADAMLGRLLNALETSPYRDNTIVALWSDHGWHLGEKDHWRKFSVWRASTRVPLIVRVPQTAPGLPGGAPTGARSDRPVNLLDLFNTMTDLAGLPRKQGLDGASLVPLLKNPKADWPHVSITQLHTPGTFSISSQDYRYIHYHDDSEELYKITVDPYEWRNLADDPNHADTLSTLRAQAPKLTKQAQSAIDRHRNR